MKSQSVVVALIAGIALIVSAFLLSSGVKALGRSVERAAVEVHAGLAASSGAGIPRQMTVDLRLANASGGGPAFRIENAAK